MEETKKTLKVKTRFIVETLRSCGYTNDTAIADIIDNSLETDVNASNVKVEFSKEKGTRTIKGIRIIDDGIGMTKETLQEAMSLGAETGKDDTTLGMYGAGMKTASLSIGKSLKVLTKVSDGDLLMAHLDIDGEHNDDKPILVNYSVIEEGTPIYNAFIAETNADHGTIVVIEKLDRLKNKDIYSFPDFLAKKLRLYFNKFIEMGYCNLYVNGKKLEFFDPIGLKSGFGTRLLRECKFSINGVDTVLKAWYVPVNKVIQGTWLDNALGRSNITSGLYIYRQHRLVGWGLNLGIISPNATIDHWLNGLRVEIFLDGKADNVFGTTFTKMITEKSKEDLDQAFADKLVEIVKPLVAVAKANQQSETPKEELPKEMLENLEKVKDSLNRNNMLAKGMKTHGKNEKNNERVDKNKDGKEHKPQENPNPTKRRKEIWFEGYDFAYDGESGLMYRADIRDGKNWIIINRDHAFYKEIFSQLCADMQSKIATLLACDIQAKNRSNYWEDEDTQKAINNYNIIMSDSFRAAYM